MASFKLLRKNPSAFCPESRSNPSPSLNPSSLWRDPSLCVNLAQRLFSVPRVWCGLMPHQTRSLKCRFPKQVLETQFND